MQTKTLEAITDRRLFSPLRAGPQTLSCCVWPLLAGNYPLWCKKLPREPGPCDVANMLSSRAGMTSMAVPKDFLGFEHSDMHRKAYCKYSLADLWSFSMRAASRVQRGLSLSDAWDPVTMDNGQWSKAAKDQWNAIALQSFVFGTIYFMLPDTDFPP